MGSDQALLLFSKSRCVPRKARAKRMLRRPCQHIPFELHLSPRSDYRDKKEPVGRIHSICCLRQVLAKTGDARTCMARVCNLKASFTALNSEDFLVYEFRSGKPTVSLKFEKYMWKSHRRSERRILLKNAEKI